MLEKLFFGSAVIKKAYLIYNIIKMFYITFETKTIFFKYISKYSHN